MLWLDVKYANMLSFALPRFKVTKQKPYTAIFRCPLCGDSQKKKTKTRGYLLQKEDSLFFYCHNCNQSMRFSRFIQTVEPGLRRGGELGRSWVKPGEHRMARLCNSMPNYHRRSNGRFPPRYWKNHHLPLTGRSWYQVGWRYRNYWKRS